MRFINYYEYKLLRSMVGFRIKKKKFYVSVDIVLYKKQKFEKKIKTY